ncbi:hypothetical protein ACOME3_006646 [Neoechinorhynchus agilis]
MHFRMAFLEPKIFFERLAKIYDKFEANLNNIDAICVAAGDNDNDTNFYCKSFSVQIWLFGMELHNTIILFLHDTVLFVSAGTTIQKIKDMIQSCTREFNVHRLKFEFLQISGERNDCSKVFKRAIEFIKSSRLGKTVGVFIKDKSRGYFVKEWTKHLEVFNREDVSYQFCELMACRDVHELAYIQKACDYLVDIFNRYLKKEMCDIFSQERKVKHSKLASKMYNLISNTTYVSKEDLKHIDVAFEPIVQSGEKCSLKFSFQSNEEFIKLNTIVCMFGLRYRGYCSSITRTFYVCPSDTMTKVAEAMLEIYDFLLAKLKNGAVLS